VRDRDRRVPDDFLGDAARDEVIEPGSAGRPNDNHIDRIRLREVDDLFLGTPWRMSVVTSTSARVADSSASVAAAAAASSGSFRRRSCWSSACGPSSDTERTCGSRRVDSRVRSRDRSPDGPRRSRPSQGVYPDTSVDYPLERRPDTSLTCRCLPAMRRSDFLRTPPPTRARSSGTRSDASTPHRSPIDPLLLPTPRDSSGNDTGSCASRSTQSDIKSRLVSG